MFTVIPENEEPWQDFSTREAAEEYAAELAAAGIGAIIEETDGDVV